MKVNIAHFKTMQDLYVLEGILAIVFGIAILFWPQLTSAVFIFLFAGYAVTHGLILWVYAYLADSNHQPSSLYTGEGFISIIIGMFIFLWPALSAVVLLFTVAIWAMAIGLFKIVAAIKDRHQYHNVWFPILLGITFVYLGLMMLTNAQAGVLAFRYVLSFVGVIAGTGLLLMVYQFNQIEKTTDF